MAIDPQGTKLYISDAAAPQSPGDFQTVGIGVVDIATARERGIPVCNVPSYSTDAVAEFVMGMILDFHKQIRYHSDLCHRGAWQNAEDFCFWQNPNFSELAGKTIGIVGFGAIGQRLGELATAFKMKILAVGRSRQAKPGYAFDWAELDTVFEQSDIISLHCPLTPETEGMIHRERLKRMKSSALLINTARGPLVVEQDLADALNAGTLAGAACDVVSLEPIRADNPLLAARNLILTPHIAWAALEARRRLMASTAANVRAFLTGRPIHMVNG